MGEISLDRLLSADLLLAVKHPAAFTALLDALVRRFRVYAVVRNPRAILSSWQTVPFPVREGHVPRGERFDPQLRETVARIDDRLDRQLHLLSWFFGRYHELFAETSVIRYEGLVASGGAARSTIATRAAALQVPLENRDKDRGLCDQELARALGERLLATDGPWWRFYSKESVDELRAH